MSNVETLPVARGPSYAAVTMEQMGGGATLTPQNLGDVVAFAKLMATAQHAVPKHLRDNPGACMAVTMQALRWAMDPFAVASKSYAASDKLSYEAQLIAAVVNTRADLARRPAYEYSGAGEKRRCKVTLTFRDGSVHDYESPEFAKITPKNSPLWKSDPDQQLGYYTIRSAARRHCPEVLLGVYDRDELEAIEHPRDVTPAPAETLRREAIAPPAVIEIVDEPEEVEVRPTDALDVTIDRDTGEIVLEHAELPDPVETAAALTKRIEDCQSEAELVGVWTAAQAEIAKLKRDDPQSYHDLVRAKDRRKAEFAR